MSEYPFYNLFKQNPLQALKVARQDDELSIHETICKYSANFHDYTYRVIRNAGFTILFIKIGSLILHHRRSLALSAPKNILSGGLKYIGIPAFVSWRMQASRYNIMMSNLEDLKDPEINQRFQEILDEQNKNKQKQI